MFYREMPDGQIVKLTTLQWADWKTEHPEEYEAEHRVALDVVNGLTISTVNLFIDHRFGEGPVLIYETMIFDQSDPGHEWSELYCDRYPTLAMAKMGHQKAIDAVKAGEVKPRLQGAEEEGAG